MYDSRITDINRAAREARLLCNVIIRQTSVKPYYGKRGAAAMYAGEDTSREQQRRICEAVEAMNHVAELLREIGVAGGMAEAHVREILAGDDMRTQVTILHDDSDKNTASNSEKITLQK